MNGNANIAGHLPEMAALRPNEFAFHLRSWIDAFGRSFEWLDQWSNQIANEIQSLGIKPGMRAALMVPPGYDFTGFSFGLFKAGLVVVLIDPGMGWRGLYKCLEVAAPEVFVTLPLGHLFRKVLGWAKFSIQFAVNSTSRRWHPECRTRSITPVLHQARPDDLAAILFTSGSTGPAKGAVYTHGMFQEQLQTLKDTFTIDCGEVDLCTFPLFSLFAPALGMTSIIPPMNPTKPARANPRKLVGMISRFSVTNIFGSPALIDVLSRYGEKHDLKLPTVRRVISAGAPVPASVIERMTKMLPAGVQLFTPYGATEALPVSVIGSDEILQETRFKTDQGAGICVGRPVGRIEVRIIPILDAPLKTFPEAMPTGKIGEITVRGPVVSKSYWRNPAADALHKIPDGDTVWHRMGDVGYFDDQGRLWFCGRKSQRVVLPDQTLFTIPCEAIFNTHPAVFRSALVAVNQRPVICVELEKSYKVNHSQLIEELRARRLHLPFTSCINDFLVYPRSFPVDIRHNAKINREKLAIWAARRMR